MATLTATSSGSNYRQGSSYPPSSYIGNDDGGSTVWCDRQKSGATFTTDTAYVRFNGSSLSGGGTVTAATLRLWITSRQDGDNKYSLTAEFYDFGGSSDSGDFAEEVTAACVTPVDLTGISTGAYVDLVLTDVSGVSTSGNFGFRITLVSQSTAAPAGSNGVVITSHTGTNKPELVVTQSSGTTPVGRTLDVVWHVKGTAARTLDASWHVKALAGRTLGVLWDARAHVSRPIELLWDTKAHVGRVLEALWHVWVPVAAPVLDVAWHVKALVGATLSTHWNVEGSKTPVGRVLDVAWDVREKVGRDLGVVWGVRSLVGGVFTTSWHVRSVVVYSWYTMWDVRKAVRADVAVSWNVESHAGPPAVLPPQSGAMVMGVVKAMPPVTVSGVITGCKRFSAVLVDAASSAVVNVRDGDGAGAILATVRLGAAGSQSVVFGGEIVTKTGVYVEIVSGTPTVVVYKA